MTKAFGIDISKYQSSADGLKKMDFTAIPKHKEEVTFIVARAGISWGYQDPMFNYYWAEMAKLPVGRMAYHVLYFGESALAQMDSLFKILDGKTNYTNDRIALDLEVEGINTRSLITATTKKCLDICKARTGRYPVVYSRANWVDAFLNVKDLPSLDWWLATYKKASLIPISGPEHAGPPYLPKGVNTYLIHQTTDKGKGIGSVSTYMDYNRWNGTKTDVVRYFGGTAVDLPAPPPNQVLFKARCIVSALYKRNGPGMNYQVVGTLNMGDIVSVYEQRNGWYRIQPDAEVWSSGAPEYLQKVEEGDSSQVELFKAVCIVSALYKRGGPGKQYKILGNLIRNEVVPVYEVKYGWYRISPSDSIWCSGADYYMQRR